MATKAIKSERVWLDGRLRPATIWLADGRISAIQSPGQDERAPERGEEANSNSHSENRADGGQAVIDVGRDVLMPGGIDIHVHINEPGRTSWEGFATATKAAAVGGITTVVDMPLNCDPVITTISAWEQKLKAATPDKLWVNCAFYAGVVPGHIDDLDDLLARGAVAGKAFMIDSGIGDFPAADVATLREGMGVLARYGRPLLAHAEIDLGHRWPANGGERDYGNYLASRPPAMELAAIRQLIELCRETGCATHIVHLSAAEGVELIDEAKGEGLPITVETAPHYLYFAAEEIPDGATSFKCAPPIREAANQKKLIAALINGSIDIVATDHSPSEPSLKKLESGDFARAWGGISSLQWLLPITWTVLSGYQSALTLPEKIAKLHQLVTVNAAHLLDLDVGTAVAVGQPANLIAWDPEGQTTVNRSTIYHRHPVTPYLDQTFSGRVTHSWVNGVWTHQNNYSTNFLSDGPNGRLML